MNISIKKQKKIAIEMWQYIKAQIEQYQPMYSITKAKGDWLKRNYPDIQWKNTCLLCTLYSHPYIVNDCYNGFACPDCPLSKRYKGYASYGCALDGNTPWNRVVSYEEDRDTAIKACDEIIAVIKELPVAIGEQL